MMERWQNVQNEQAIDLTFLKLSENMVDNLMRPFRGNAAGTDFDWLGDGQGLDNIQVGVPERVQAGVINYNRINTVLQQFKANVFGPAGVQILHNRMLHKPMRYFAKEYFTRLHTHVQMNFAKTIECFMDAKLKVECREFGFRRAWLKRYLLKCLNGRQQYDQEAVLAFLAARHQEADRQFFFGVVDEIMSMCWSFLLDIDHEHPLGAKTRRMHAKGCLSVARSTTNRCTKTKMKFNTGRYLVIMYCFQRAIQALSEQRGLQLKQFNLLPQFKVGCQHMILGQKKGNMCVDSGFLGDKLREMVNIVNFTRSFQTLDAVKNRKLKEWILQNAKMMQPKSIKVCDGSQSENSENLKQLVDKGVLIPLSQQKRPNSFLCRTHPQDVARSEGATFICSQNKSDAGPTNNWRDPQEMKQHLFSLFNGSMKGRDMYVIPFSMGPLGSPYSIHGVQLTDSPYVVASMQVMTRMGQPVLDLLNKDENARYVPCLHSVGYPLSEGQPDVNWPCNIKKRAVAHFPETKEIMSFGSQYRGNSILGKKALALRIASVLGREEGWLGEHMLILGITTPQNKKYYIAAAFPSACGKTNLAMITSNLPGYKVECIGDDIAWMRFNKKDGRLYAINPEAGFFGVAPGTSYHTNYNAMKTIEKNAIFTNVALTADGDVWWEGMSKQAPGQLTSWLGEKWIQPSDKAKAKANPAAHPNSRFTAPLSQCPSIDPKWDAPDGVPISAILFGGRRRNLVPLAYETFDWNHGVLTGSSVASEMTSASDEGSKKNQLRFDPFAMLPFCGYHMGDYFQHWIDMKDSKVDGIENKKLPKLFHVNWFRQDEKGNFMWPGFAENMRVLKWIIGRIEGTADATKTPIGYVPTVESLDLKSYDSNGGSGEKMPDREVMQKLLHVDSKAYVQETEKIKDYHKKFGSKFPKQLKAEMDKLVQRLNEDLKN
ncbi:hypothetical protein MP228_003361 [Amoeboaphelidium protococcarum]|nr:hypothetical protein MP228_003361 [Amoeboaphelidium protococcarum]